MILQRTPEGVIAIKQEDHAALAGFFLEHWSDHNFAHDPERDAIILATGEHDNGWRQFDEKPELDSTTGFPVEFSAITADQAFAIWRKGSQTYMDQDPFVALLITHHAYSIHEQTQKRNAEWKPFFTEFAQQRAELRTRLGLAHPQVERAYSYLRMMDWFSLAYCSQYNLGAEKPEQYAGYHFKRDGDEFLIRPYPFDAKDLRYQLPVYPLDPNGYTDAESLHAAFVTPEYREVILNPLSRSR